LFIYLRQLPNPNITAPQNSLLELVYYLDQDTVPKLAYKRNIPDTEAAVWKKTLLRVAPATLYILVETLEANQ
jgi:hypothetical protein